MKTVKFVSVRKVVLVALIILILNKLTVISVRSQLCMYLTSQVVKENLVLGGVKIKTNGLILKPKNVLRIVLKLIITNGQIIQQEFASHIVLILRLKCCIIKHVLGHHVQKILGLIEKLAIQKIRINRLNIWMMKLGRFVANVNPKIVKSAVNGIINNAKLAKTISLWITGNMVLALINAQRDLSKS